MRTVNRRTQFPVGQGFFHFGELMDGDTTVFRYVYDCGSMQRYRESRSACINHVLSQHGGEVLDVLFISHAHADHVNGVEQLLNASSGMKVDAIVLPLWTLEERVLAFARTHAEDPAAAATDFYVQFVVDPAAALQRLEPRRILFIRSSGGGRAPFSNAQPDLSPDSPRFPNEEASWKLVGRGAVTEHDDGSADGAPSSSWIVPDSVGLMTRVAGSGVEWLLAPYVDSAVASKINAFVSRLASELGTTPKALRRWLKTKDNVLSLLTTNAAELRAAYSEVDKDLNITSLCLYSGPEPTGKHEYRYAAFAGAIRIQPSAPRIAWLGTGDAALAEGRRRRSFLEHYGALLNEVALLTVPHHGSEHNFHVELLDRIAPLVCVAAADKFSTWRHPGSHVVQAIASSGCFLSVVTSHARSRVVEVARIS